MTVTLTQSDNLIQDSDSGVAADTTSTSPALSSTSDRDTLVEDARHESPTSIPAIMITIHDSKAINTSINGSPTKPNSYLNSHTLGGGSMTARRPLRSSPLAGPPALFDSNSDSESVETKDTSPVSSISACSPVSLSWNIPLTTSPLDAYPKPPTSIISSGLDMAESCSSTAQPTRALRIRGPRMPPQCHLHPRASMPRNEPAPIQNIEKRVADGFDRRGCTCSASSDSNQGSGKSGKNVLRKRRASGGDPIALTMALYTSTSGSNNNRPTMGQNKKTTEMEMEMGMGIIEKQKQTYNDKNKNKNKGPAMKAAPPPSLRSTDGDVFSSERVEWTMAALEAGIGRGMTHLCDASASLRDCVDGGCRGAGVPILRIEECDDEDDAGGGRMVGGRAETAISENGSASDGRSLRSDVGWLNGVFDGESRRRKEGRESGSSVRFSSNLGVPSGGDPRPMSMLEFGCRGDCSHRRSTVEGSGSTNEYQEFGVLKPQSQHLLSPWSAVSGAGNDSDAKGRRRSMGNVGSRMTDSLTSGPTTPPSSNRRSTSTLSPLSNSSSPSSRSFASSNTSSPPQSPTPKTKRAADNSWYTVNPYGEIPRFTRLGLSSPNVIMPISAKEHFRSKQRGSSNASANAQRRWSNFPASTSTSSNLSPSSPTALAQETPTSPVSDQETTEVELDGDTLSRSSSASATTSTSSSCWSACTTSTATTPAPTSEESDSMERVGSMDSVDIAGRVLDENKEPETVKQVNYGGAKKSHRKSLGAMMGLKGGLLVTPSSGSGDHTRRDVAPQTHPYARSDLTLMSEDVKGSATKSSQSLAQDQPHLKLSVNHTSSTPVLGKYPSSYSITSVGQWGVGGMGEGKKLKRGDSSMRRWWKSLVGGAR